MATSDVIRSASFSNIESSLQINSRNLNQAIKLSTVFESPIISFFCGHSLGYDSFDSVLAQKYMGDVKNAMENIDEEPLKKYNFIDKVKVSMYDYVKSVTDIAPPFRLIPATALTAAATDNLLSVTENGAYLCQEGVGLFNPRTRERLKVVQTANNNNNILVVRGADGSTISPILTNDTLLVTGVALDMYTPQVTTSRPIPRRGQTLYNGFQRLFTPGTPINNLIEESALLYNGQFFELIDQEHVRAHKSSLINSLIYSEYGDLTTEEKSNPEANINKFNGFAYWARKNPVSVGFTDIGPLTTAKFEALMTWFDTYDNLGTRKNPMVYICGRTAYTALQSYLKAGVLVTTTEGFVPGTMGGSVHKYITDSGRLIYICVDDYLNLIGRGGDIIMAAENNLTLYVGVDKFLTPHNQALGKEGMLEGAARFVDRIPNFSVGSNQKFDMLISQFSMLPAYIELCAMATGITK